MKQRSKRRFFESLPQLTTGSSQLVKALLKRFSIAVALLAGFTASGWAEVRLPGFFSDHMVLQQEKEIVIWGWATPNESVSVTMGNASTKAQADEAGEWRVTLPARKASFQPETIEVKGTNRITINDVLIGEVWLCSGQSNMEWTVRISQNAKEEISAGKFPAIRHFKVPHRPSMRPLNDIQSSWQACSPETVGEFTAVGYFMARTLHKELNVPIGLVNSSWGGTRVEPWTPPNGFASVQSLTDIHESVIGRTPGTEAYQSNLQSHIRATERWLAETKSKLAAGDEVSPSPNFPAGLMPFKSHQDPTMLYNGMIHALVGLPIRGAIWYQGESNRADGMQYFEKKKALIGGWRELWNQGDFPFYFVQIAPFQYGNDSATQLPELWEAQARVKTLPNTEMVVTNDIATLNDIHPPNKQDVGLRLARIALKKDYGRDQIVAFSPEFEKLEVLDGRLRITLKNTGGSLKTRDGKPPSHFEIIGVDSDGFQPAEAQIDRNAIILSSDKVEAPTAFRFAWHKTAEPNLTGQTGLPVGAFRAGRVPTLLDTIPNATELELVYDLDLSKLQNAITYDVNRAANVQQFSRVAYLLELESEEFGAQHVFASMDAFTDDARQLGVPTASAGHKFQRPVSNLKVYSNVPGLNTERSMPQGFIEFWPNNYATDNTSHVPNASDRIYDFGDSPVGAPNGYGCMQVHRPGNEQTIFAINHWSQGGNADVGIGNSSGDTRDWTFRANANQYRAKRLRIYVR